LNHWAAITAFCLPCLSSGAVADLFNHKNNFEYTLSLGQRGDNFRWDINGPVNELTPSFNVLSELDWKNINSTPLQLEAHYRANRKFSVAGHVSYALISSGQVRDSDYCGQNRSREFSRSISKGEGELLDWELRSQLEVVRQAMYGLSIIGGYTRFKQDFDLNTGIQTIGGVENFENLCTQNPQDPIIPPDPGSVLADLRTSYNARWQGPWLGGGGHWRHNRIHLVAEAQLYWLEYQGRGSWNSRSPAFRFIQSAQGYGIGMQFNAGYRLIDGVETGVQVRWLSTVTQSGNESIRQQLGGDSIIFNQGNTFNGAKWTTINYAIFIKLTH